MKLSNSSLTRVALNAGLLAILCLSLLPPASSRASGLGSLHSGTLAAPPAQDSEYLEIDNAREIKILGDTAFIGYVRENRYPGLLIVDIGDPARPVPLLDIPLGDGPSVFIEVEDDRAYVATVDAVGVFDVSDPSSPSLVMQDGPVGLIGDMAYQDGYIYVTEINEGVFVYDVKNSNSPVRVGTYAKGFGESIERVQVVDNLGFFMRRGGQVDIVDVSNPAQMTPLGVYQTTGLPSEVALVDSTTFLGSDFDFGAPGTFEVLDLQNPSAPSRLAEYPFNNVYALTIVENSAYVLTTGSETLDAGIYVLDISNERDLQQIGYHRIYASEDMAIKDGYAFLAGGMGLRVVDMRNPAASSDVRLDLRPTPTPLPSPTPQVLPARLDIGISPLGQIVGGDKPGTEGQRGLAPAHVIAIDGGIAYVAAGENGIHVVDITNPSALRSIAMAPTSDMALNITVKDGIAYVGELGFFEIIDVRDPQNPQQLNRTWAGTGPPAVASSGDMLFVVADSELRIFDVSDAASPVLLVSYPVPQGSNNLAYDSDSKTLYVLVGDGSGLALDVSDPAAPRAAAQLTDGIGTIAEAAQGTLYGTEYSVLRAFKVANGSLEQMGQQGSDLYSGGYDQLSEGMGMRLDGNLLYVADYRNGLYIFDVSNPAAMYVRGYYYPGDFWQYVDVDVADGIVYAALEDGGLVSFSVSGAGLSSPTPQPTRPVAPAATPEPPSGLSGKIVFLSSRDYPDYRPESGGLGPHDIYVMAPDGTNQTRISSGERLSNMSAPAVSPDGLKIAVGRYGNKLTIYDKSGGQVSEYQAPGDVNALWVNDWSSDGNRLLLTVFGPSSGSSDWNEEIFDLDLASGQWTQLTDNNQRNLFAAWSPDGTQIAYMQDYTLWLMDSDGRNPRRLIDGEARDMDWSSDGTKIAFESQEVPAASSDYDIWTVNPDGTGELRVTNTPGLYIYAPSWSPDGKQIAFVAYPDGPSRLGQISVLDIDSGETTQITSEGDNIAPFWVSSVQIEAELFDEKLAYIEALSKLPLTLFDLIPIPIDAGYDETSGRNAVQFVRQQSDQGTLPEKRASAFRRLVLQEKVMAQLYSMAAQSSQDTAASFIDFIAIGFAFINAVHTSTAPIIAQGGPMGELAERVMQRMLTLIIATMELPMEWIIDAVVPASWDPQAIQKAREVLFDWATVQIDAGATLTDIVLNNTVKGGLAATLLRPYVSLTQPVVDQAANEVFLEEPVLVQGSDESAVDYADEFVGDARRRTTAAHSLYEDFARGTDVAKLEIALGEIALTPALTRKWGALITATGTALGAVSTYCGLHEGVANTVKLQDWAYLSQQYLFNPAGVPPELDVPGRDSGCASAWVKVYELISDESLTSSKPAGLVQQTSAPIAQADSSQLAMALQRLAGVSKSGDQTPLLEAIDELLIAEQLTASALEQELAQVASVKSGDAHNLRIRYGTDMIGVYAYALALANTPEDADLQQALQEQIALASEQFRAYQLSLEDTLGAEVGPLLSSDALHNRVENASGEDTALQATSSPSDGPRTSQESSATEAGGSEAEERQGDASQPWVVAIVLGLTVAGVAGLALARRRKARSG